MKKILLLLLVSVIANLAKAQDDTGSGVGAFMRSNQRSYVVIAVMATILIGLFLYLARLEKKINKLEKEK